MRQARSLLFRLPSLSDWLFIALFGWLLIFSTFEKHGGVLQDAATGTHIRIGDYILEHHEIPTVDMLSYTFQGQPWFAFEWLSGVVFALLHSAAGLTGVAVFCSLLITFAIWIVARQSIQRSGDALAVILLLHFVIGASSIHFIARPHVFTLLFCALSFRLLNDDLDHPSRRIWILPFLTVLWANLHPGFLALLVSLACVAAGKLLEGRSATRYAAVTGACLAASALNPYGLMLHWHVLSFLRGGWVSKLIQEHQPPNFRTSEGVYFEVLLVAGMGAAAWLITKGEFGRALWILAWAHAGLMSVRQIPLYALVMFPFAAEGVAVLIRTGAEKHAAVLRDLRNLGRDYAPLFQRSTAWPAVAVILIGMLLWGVPPGLEFSDERFPVKLAGLHGDALSNHRVFTTDAWADYLTYQLYPHFQSFIDGRGDLFGEAFSDQYLQALNGEPGWQPLFERYSVDVIFVPASSGLAKLLREGTENWSVLTENPRAVLAIRRSDTPRNELTLEPVKASRAMLKP